MQYADNFQINQKLITYNTWTPQAATQKASKQKIDLSSAFTYRAERYSSYTTDKPFNRKG